MTATSNARPVPVPGIESAPYWEAMNQGRLVLQRCAACSKLRHYPRCMCDACHSMEVDWITATGCGRVHSWAVMHHAFHPGFRDALPYVLVITDLDEGVRLQAPLRGAGVQSLRIGLPVQVVFEPQPDGSMLPALRLIQHNAAASTVTSSA